MHSLLKVRDERGHLLREHYQLSLCAPSFRACVCCREAHYLHESSWCLARRGLCVLCIPCLESFCFLWKSLGRYCWDRGIVFSVTVELAPVQWNTVSNFIASFFFKWTFNVHRIGKLKLHSFKLFISLFCLENIGVHALSAISIALDELSGGRNVSGEHVHTCKFEPLGSLCVIIQWRHSVTYSSPQVGRTLGILTIMHAPTWQHCRLCCVGFLLSPELRKIRYYHKLVAQEGINFWSSACTECIAFPHYHC